MRGLQNPLPQYLRNFFLWLKSKEFLIFLFFFFVSGVFWILLAIKDTRDTEILIPVRVTKVPKNVFITDGEYDTLKVSVRDNGYILIGYKLDRINDVEVNFNNFYKNDDGKISLSSQDLIKLVKTRLSASSEVISIKPDKMDIYYNHGYHEMKPVAIEGEVKPADKYTLVAKMTEPMSVKVYGSRERLFDIDSVRTEFTKIVDVTDSVRKGVRLKKIKGVKLDPEAVMVYAEADVNTEASIEVPVRGVNVPEGKEMQFTPSKVVVTYVVPSRMQESVKAEDFIVVADYNKVEEGTGQKELAIQIVKTSNLVKRSRLKQDRVLYVVERK